MQRSLFKSARKYIQKQKHPHLFCGKYISSNIHLHNHFADYGEAPQSESYDSWTNLIFALAKNDSKTAQTLFEASEMLGSGTRPNGYALVHLVQASMKLSWNFYGQQLHSYILRSGFSSNVFVSTALIGFYIRIGLLTDAQKVFVDIPHPSVVSWNSLISGCVHCGKFRKALSFFYELDRSNISADSYSLTAALTACGHLTFLQLGKSIHSKVVKLGVESTIVPSNCLIGMYGKCGSVEEAVLVFNKMVHKDTISWNSVIAANTRNGSLIQAVGFLQQMPSPNTISYNELIFGFAQFGDIEDAIKMLSTMPNPNSSSWNSIITGYVNRNRAQEALDLFYKMHSKNIEMDQFTFSSILSGRGELLRAKRMIYELGFGACGLVWRAFLGACEACKDLRTAKTVAGKVIELGCDNEYLYIVLSNISAYYGKWEDVRAVRKLMMERAMRKGVGYSWIEVEDVNPSSIFG
ncbi:hypothetical protein FEM48_Zijuj11G0061200 [Ziziphus jujuba var. spinosa]|uniref:Pentatricopeptide repeat-containing protein At5g47460 n=1 Tax=Ziziphus jujuba var. spinosa TaxID=714518 RepID=A0A978UH98_ZIZJJ|nr:hypothetical protein FEM48_Zijuj11G0061200 [Ziziphus jujuba var. spinosa]